MVNSMTGLGALSGHGAGFGWDWEIRAVNGKGRDLRLRLPDWVPGLDQAARQALNARIQRGNITLSLKLARDSDGAGRVDDATLDAVLAEIDRVEERAQGRGLVLRAPTAVDVLDLAARQGGNAPGDLGALRAALLADLPKLLDGFEDMRRREGAALGALITAQLDQIGDLVTAARDAAAARTADWRGRIADNLAKVLDNSTGADPDRVAQELALIALKADVTEELDRLEGHVSAARALLDQAGPVGRKLDFLTQEFNREANTLCAKAQHQDLTRIGLDLKAVIDQMREQVQNVE